MTRNTKPMFARFLNHRMDPFALHGVIDFDLEKLTIGVAFHCFNRFFLGRDQFAIIGAERAFALNETTPNNTRSRQSPAFNLAVQLTKDVIAIAHITNGCDASRNIQQGTILTQMAVHFIHASNECPASAVNNGCIRRDRRARLNHVANAIAVDDNRFGRRQAFGLWIEDTDIIDTNGRIEILGNARLNVFKATRRVFSRKIA